MSDALPSTDRPLTDDERLRAACDWSDYRKDYGVDRVARVRGKEHQAFLAGWTARHRESVLPTAADQPTTEPSVQAVAEALHRHESGSSRWDGCEPCTKRAQVLADAGLLAPAPQPAADLVDAIQGEVWGWLNRHEVGSHLDDAKVLELALAVRDEMRQPAADTETEVQWGVRDDDTGEIKDKTDEHSARVHVEYTGDTVMKQHVTRTPWEEA